MARATPFGDAVVARINYANPADPLSSGGSGLKSKLGVTHDADANKSVMANVDPHDMPISDARPAVPHLSIDTHGACVARLRSALPSTLEVLFEEGDHEIHRTYFPEVEDLIRRTIVADGRRPRYVFAIGTQKFTEEKWRGKFNRYSRTAHADFADVLFDNAHKMLTKRGVPAGEAQRMDIMFVNAWRPFGREVRDNHLAILDWTSVDPARDVHGLQRGATITKGSIYNTVVTHNPAHRWMYLPRMQPDEVWIFKQVDSRSRPGLAKHAFHMSFRGTDDPQSSRRAIALRLICAFDRPPAAGL